MQKYQNIFPSQRQKLESHYTTSSTSNTKNNCPVNLIKKLDYDLNLQFENTKNKVIKNLLNADESLFIEIKKTLECANSSEEQKQKKLENLSQQSNEYELVNNCSVADKKLKPLIEKIDAHINNLDLNKIDLFLPSSIINSLSKKKTIHRQKLTKKRKAGIMLFTTGLKLFRYRKNSFGLFLCSAVSFFLGRKKPEQTEEQKYNKQFLLYYVDEEFAALRTALTSTLSDLFVNFIVASKSLIEKDILEKAIQNTEPEKRPKANTVLSINQKIKLVENSLDQPDIELFCSLIQDNYLHSALFEKTKETGLIQSEIGLILLTFLEAVELIIDNDEKIEIKKEGKIKTPAIIRISKRYTSSIFKIPRSPSPLPLIVRPNDWQQDSSHPRRNFGYGGFLFNKHMNTVGINTEKSSVIVSLIKKEIDAMNYIQSNVYYVNHHYIELLKAHPHSFITAYLFKQPGFNRFHYYRGNKLIIRDITTFLETDPKYLKLKASLPKQGKKTNIYKKLLRQKELVENQYFILLNVLLEFIHTYFIADLYKNKLFYFALSIDSRGQFYYSSEGGFGLQRSTLGRNLIELRGNSSDKNIPYLPDVNNKSQYSTIDPYSKDVNPYEYEDFFTEIKDLFKIPRSYERIGARCSGTSILYGLIGSKKGLVLTNVLSSPQDGAKKKCIYESFRNQLQSQLSELENVFPQKFVEKQADLTETSSNSVKAKLIFILNKIEDQLLTRKHVKNFIMRQNFAQKNKGRSEYIHTYFIKPLVALDAKRFTSKTDNEFLENVSFALAHWIDKNYKKYFPELSKFCSTVRTQINHEKPRVLTLGDKVSGKFQIQHIKYTTLQAPKPLFSNQSKKYNLLKYRIPTNETDRRQASQSTIANYIQFIESRLCNSVIAKAMKRGIPLWTDRDCFYTDKNNLEIVKKLYFESYHEFVINNKALTVFFNSNETKNIPAVKKFLSKINSNLNKIISDVDTGQVVVSRHILS